PGPADAAARTTWRRRSGTASGPPGSVAHLDAAIEGPLVAGARRALRRLGHGQPHRIGPVLTGAFGLCRLLIHVIEAAEIAEAELPDLPAAHAHGRVLDPGVVEPAPDDALEQRPQRQRETGHLHLVRAGDAAVVGPEVVELDVLLEHEAELAVLDRADEVGRLHVHEAERGRAQVDDRELVVALHQAPVVALREDAELAVVLVVRAHHVLVVVVVPDHHLFRAVHVHRARRFENG